MRLFHCGLIAATLMLGCTSSRWGADRATVLGRGLGPFQQNKEGLARRESAGSDLISQGNSSAKSAATVDRDLLTTRQGKAGRTNVTTDSQYNSIRQVSGDSDPQSLAEIVAANIAVSPANPPSAQNTGSSKRLQIPTELPGAAAPAIDLPPHDVDDVQGRMKDIQQSFGALPKVVQGRVNSAESGRTYTLDELQSVALASNPVMTQAGAQVMALRGTALQAGLHPNPVMGYESDSVGSNGNPNYQGGYISTVIKTAGKLDLAESAANVDVWNADLMRQKTRIELITQVRGAYFAALIARENVKVTEALVRFTDSVYQIQLDQLRGGFVSTYEPIQLRALAVQARTALTQARNRYDASWRQLAAIVGTPDLQIGELEGSPDMPIPEIDYDKALPYVLSNHTDVLAARNSEAQARINLRLQEVNRIPDLNFYTALQKDYTTAPIYRLTYNMQVGIPVPIFDKNQGNILNANGTLMKASQEAARVQNDLATKLADATERYANASNLVEMYRDHILPDQARAYRGVYERHQQQPDLVGFADVVTAQQTLLVSIGIYINSLAIRWQAFTDIGSLIQAETIGGIEAIIQSGEMIREEETPMVVPPLPTLELNR
jgi:cobalt-zinc-cadmium efflux system outer membrane protein